MVRTWCVLYIFETYLAPQRRALFFTSQVVQAGVFCAFSLGNVLQPTSAYTFSTSQVPKVVRTCVFCAFSLRNVLRATTACTFSTSQLPKWSVHGVFCSFSFRNVLRATTACTFSTSQLPKVVRTWCVLYIFTSKRASRHNGVHFFDISTSKSGPYMVYFKHFHFEMCFAPQRRALFRHLNFQKWSVHGVFCVFSLRNVLRATTACTFSTSQLPKVVRTWCVLYIFTSKRASRHNSVHFFDISTSKSGPYMVCFVHFHFETCFAPQRRAPFSTSQVPKVVRT